MNCFFLNEDELNSLSYIITKFYSKLLYFASEAGIEFKYSHSFNSDAILIQLYYSPISRFDFKYQSLN